MAAAAQAFKVLTEFKFETGSALVNAGKLQQAADGISQSADGALFSLKKLGLGLVTDFGLGASSALGVLSQSVRAFEAFKQNQLVVSNILSANMQNLTGDVDTFNDRMMVSKNILSDISKDARKFGLNESALASQTKQLGALLIPKGLAGDNLGNARDLGRNFLKSAPSLGVDPATAQQQLARIVEGKSGGNNTLFNRLVNETGAFQKELKGAANAARAFNQFDIQKRFKILNQGMAQFASDAEVLGAQANGIGRLLTVLRDTFVGFTGVLLPLGEALSGPIRDAIKELTVLVDTDLRRIILQISKMIKAYNGDFRKLIIDLTQLKQLGNDFRKASFIAALIGIAGVLRMFVGTAFKPLIAIAAPLIGIMKAVGGAFLVMGKAIGPGFVKVIGIAVSAFLGVLPVFLALTAFFQLISRAKAIAKVADADAVTGLTAKLLESINGIRLSIGKILAPFASLFDGLARLIAPLFSVSTYLSVFVSLIGFVDRFFQTMILGIHSIATVIATIFSNIASGNFNIFGGLMENLSSEYNSLKGQYDGLTKDGDGNNAVAKNVTNIGKVEIKNEFKEKFEPDRIAFSIKDQLLKAAQNPTAARNKGFALPGLGG